ncbi:hypothetical protein LCGC14_1812000 [marine sediment metagenome]|uniref:Uncharacterized protein n=1 Tax=marine sediment metagenome TaxID=412755 RepID=A0A0F9JL44_9ZZZZ
MADYYQYRITVEAQVGKILDKLPSEQWEFALHVCEERGMIAKLEWRLITDEGILPLLEDARRFIKLKDGRVICPWEILAGMNLVPDVELG